MIPDSDLKRRLVIRVPLSQKRCTLHSQNDKHVRDVNVRIGKTLQHINALQQMTIHVFYRLVYI